MTTLRLSLTAAQAAALREHAEGLGVPPTTAARLALLDMIAPAFGLPSGDA